MDLESAPLLATPIAGTASEPITLNKEPPPNRDQEASIREAHIARVLPIAFAAAFAIAATSATAVFAYARLMCKDAANCDQDEKKRYAGVVALATTIANVCGVLAVGLLREYTASQPKLGLFFWLTCRGVSIGFLVAGGTWNHQSSHCRCYFQRTQWLTLMRLLVLLNSIHVAVAGRIFEGMATDNVLHYTLGAVYVKSEDPATFARLMGTSLALYMSAMSMSPTIVTLLPNFVWSFGVAIAVLGASVVYLALYVPTAVCTKDRDPNQEQPSPRTRTCAELLRLFLEPLLYFYREPFSMLPGMAIFLYNAAHAYLFPAIMVHASIRFGFTSKENGYMISIAALTSSIYLFIVLFAIPNATKWFRTNARRRQDTGAIEERTRGRRLRNPDIGYALLSMLVQLIVLPFFHLVNHARELYGLVVLIALGLSAPSFIKSYAVTRTDAKDSSLAGMAVLESLGGLFSPLILGTTQSLTNGGSVFVVASCLVGGAMLCLVTSSLARR